MRGVKGNLSSRMAPDVVEIAAVVVYRRLGSKFAVENSGLTRFEIVDADFTVGIFLKRIAVADKEASVGGEDRMRVKRKMGGL